MEFFGCPSPKLERVLLLFELLLKEITARAIENEKMKFEDTVDEENIIPLNLF